VEYRDLPDWEKFYHEGKGYHKTVRGGLGRPQVFTPEIIQNIAAMGIEKYFMSIFLRRGILPRNHTMGDLVEDLKVFLPLPADLEKSLLYFDSLQQICSIDNFKITKPGPEDVSLFVDAIDRVALLAEREIGV
jgi:hypothetical protein